MKRGWMLLVVMITSMTMAMAQESEEMQVADTIPPISLQRQMYIYTLANKYNDLQVSKQALYTILSYAPGNTAIMDSLALLYYQTQEFVSAALMSQDVLKLNPTDMLAAEIGAISFEALGVPAKAIPLYEKMYLNNNDLSILYQIAYLQYTAGRYNEAVVNLETIIADKESDTRQLIFPMTDGRQQQVPLKAGAYRLIGMLEAAQGNTDAAKESYDKALEITPIFDSVIELKKELGN